MHINLKAKKTKAFTPLENLRFLTGFTLLEMIIALSIYSMLSVCMAVILSSSLSAYRVATNKKYAVQKAATAMEWLARDIGETANASLSAINPSDINISVGTDYIRYYFNNTEQTIRRQYNTTASGDLLAENVTGFNLRYYDINNTITTNATNVEMVEIYINTTSRDQTFRGYTVAGFAP